MSKHIDTGRSGGGGAPIVFKSGEPVSVICVASTFTGVSYANNGDKVQLISAGVHGLTTSPAVGASVYVAWSGGGGVTGLYKVLSVDSTTAFTIDLAYVAGLGTPSVAAHTTNISVFTQKIPPLLKNSYVRYDAYVKHIATASFARSAVILLNGVTIAGTLGTSSASFDSFHFINSFKNNNNVAEQSVNTTPCIGTSSGGNAVRTIDTSVETTLDIQLKINAENNVITLVSCIIEVFL